MKCLRAIYWLSAYAGSNPVLRINLFNDMEDKKIALVTGANKGIGFEACRQLAKSGFKVILTSRDEKKGKNASERLKSEGLDIVYHQLDVVDDGSMKNIFGFVKKEFEKLDVLVNNAGVLLENTDMNDKKVNRFSFDSKNYTELEDFPDLSVFKLSDEIYRKTFEINLFGPLRMCRAFIPLMIRNNYGRVVNVSSGMGQLSGELKEMGGGWPAYRISKTALNAVTRIFAYEAVGYNIKINSMCPGWVKTDMGGPNAERTPQQAAETIVWLAMLPDNGPTGGFFRDKKRIEW